MSHDQHRIAHFEILAELGRGTTGVVYCARDLLLDQFIALKVLALDSQDDHEARMHRFLREARIVAGMASKSETNIPAIHEVGQSDGKCYMVRDFVDGETLEERVLEGSLSGLAAARVLATIAGAVARVHKRGCVHRNLQPANILVTKDGIPKLIGFGHAAAIDDRSVAGHAGSTILADVESLQAMLDWVFQTKKESMPSCLRAAAKRGAVSNAAELETLIAQGLR